MYDIIQGVLYFLIICLICYILKNIHFIIISTQKYTDSRVSTGSYVANRASDKIAQLHDHIWCCRSGSAADTQALTDYVRHYLAQLAVETGRPPEVKVAAHLMRRLCYENKDNLMAGVIIGGWDPVNGGTVYNIPLGGACIPMPFALGGSGSTFIYGLVDAEYKENMTKDEALALVKKAVSHAMARDGSSGGIIRTLVATEDGNVRDYVSGNACESIVVVIHSISLAQFHTYTHSTCLSSFS